MIKRIFTRISINRPLLALVVTIILMILLIVSDLKMYQNLSKQLTTMKISEVFHKQIGQTMEGKPIIDIRPDSLRKDHDKYQDLYDAALKVQPAVSSSTVKSITLGELLGMKKNRQMTNLDYFHMGITEKEMYPENSPYIDKLLVDMATMPIKNVAEYNKGTQLKLKITFENGMQALCKLMRFPREQDAFPNQLYWAEFERHNAEIAGFHVDRLLGFRRGIPTTGRLVNLVEEIIQLSNKEFQETVFVSPPPDENVCVYGNCEIYCDSDHPTCANKDKIEGSFMALYPDHNLTKLKVYDQPWFPYILNNEKDEWETNPKYCEKVKAMYPMSKYRDMLDFMDTAVLDFLIGNSDRHDFLTFNVFGENSFHIHYDNGRAFGRPSFDYMALLAPLTQCCFIRVSTLKKLLEFHNGDKPLSVALSEAMAADPVAPVLLEKHLKPMDRRIDIILNEIRKCIEKTSIDDVVRSN